MARVEEYVTEAQERLGDVVHWRNSSRCHAAVIIEKVYGSAVEVYVFPTTYREGSNEAASHGDSSSGYCWHHLAECE